MTYAKKALAIAAAAIILAASVAAVAYTMGVKRGEADVLGRMTVWSGDWTMDRDTDAGRSYRLDESSSENGDGTVYLDLDGEWVRMDLYLW